MRILIVKLSSIGDVVHTLPAAALLRRALPHARIAWVVERRASEIIKDSQALDELIEIDTPAWRKQLLGSAMHDQVRARLAELRGSASNTETAGRVDIAIDFQGLIKSGLIAKASGAKLSIGFATDELREKASRLFLTDQVPAAHIKHVIEKNIALARRAIRFASTESSPTVNDAGNQYDFPITVTADDERYIDQVINGRGGRFAIINPGGGWPTKLWPAQAYGQLADRLYGEHGLKSFITYGPGEEVLAQTVASNSRSGLAVPLASSLKQFVALARRAALFVGGDTGPLHLAAASGTPIVGIYGATSPERNGPFNKRDVTVGRDLWCRQDCHRRSCWHWECMDIPVTEVSRAVSKRLAAEALAIDGADQEAQGRIIQTVRLRSDRIAQ
jgi:heptosyltransferase I